MCVLFVFLMTVEVARSHPNETGDFAATTHCQLCATAHIAVVSQPFALSAYVLRLIGTVLVGDVSRGSPAVIFTTYIRPPPAQTAVA